MSIGKALILRTASFGFVESLVRKSFLFRPLVKRFIAGDTLEQALQQAELLCERGLLATMDNLGENTKTPEEANSAAATYCRMLERIAQSKHAPKITISIKLTQCGFDIGDEFCEKNYRNVLAEAAKVGNTVCVDMESSDYTERTLQMMERVFPDMPNTGTVLQSYLRRSIDDTKRMIKLGCSIRVVKGAYLEPATVAFEDKKDVDRVYVEMCKMLLREGNNPAIATHDEKIVNEILQFVRDEKIEPKSFEFQMLYGIRRDLQDRLAKDGYNIRIYVPYGDSWYPYFTRRLAERPANSLFILKSLFKG